MSKKKQKTQPRNNVARFMDQVNKSGYHEDLKRKFMSDNKRKIQEGLRE